MSPGFLGLATLDLDRSEMLRSGGEVGRDAGSWRG
jgi:hypothetical protein